MSKNSKQVVASEKNSAKSAVAKTKKTDSAPAKDKKETTSTASAVFLAKGAAQDALQGRVGARTHAIHAVLLDAARTGALMKTKAIEDAATLFMQQTDEDAKCNATASHLNTMREKRAYLVREQGAWRLSDDALKLCGAKWAQDASAPAKKKKVKK